MSFFTYVPGADLNIGKKVRIKSVVNAGKGDSKV